MRFVDMHPLKPEYPHVSVMQDDRVYDLHNTGNLTGIELNNRLRTLILRWEVVDDSATKSGERRATVTLTFGGLRSLAMQGPVLDVDPSDSELDFILLQKTNLGSRLTIELIGGGKFEIEATSCTLATVAGL